MAWNKTFKQENREIAMPSFFIHSYGFKYSYDYSKDTLILRDVPCYNVTSNHNEIVEVVIHHFVDKNQLDIYIECATVNANLIKYLFRLIKILNNYREQNRKIQIFWNYSMNEELIELGLDLTSFCNFPFEFVDS